MSDILKSEWKYLIATKKLSELRPCRRICAFSVFSSIGCGLSVEFDTFKCSQFEHCLELLRPDHAHRVHTTSEIAFERWINSCSCSVLLVVFDVFKSLMLERHCRLYAL